jgi:dihydroflavonol-4-reductase
MKTLVTGANGFIGSAVVLEGLRVEIAPGDLQDFTSMRSALKGCRRLFHVAALYSLWLPKPSEMYKTNVTGTRHLMEAAMEEGIERVVYTSTVGAVGIPIDGGWGNESTPLEWDDVFGHYKRSKYMAEKEVLGLVEKGLPAVVVNPSAPIGPRDVKPTPTGQIVVDFLKGRMWAFMETGLNLVDVEDVAEGHLLAAEKGRIGERYILGNKNMMLKEVLELLSGITGRKAPSLKIPYKIVLPMAYLNTGLSNYITHRAPRIPLEGVKMAKRSMFFDSSKAVRELGFPQRSVEDALRRAVDWFQNNGYI